MGPLPMATVLVAAACLAASSCPARAEGDGRLGLVLRRATQDGNDLTLHAGFVGGRAVQAWGTTPPDNNIPHDPRELTLRLQDGRVRGSVSLNVRYVLYRFTIDAAVAAGGRAEGTYLGAYCPAGTQPVRGQLSGSRQAPVAKGTPARLQRRWSCATARRRAASSTRCARG